eukprot:CAMPEP_0194503886 /NCGR_PEP_ID=MMETSP0253-20130528/28636_1 /TAXON_ID=2966 /ORGANISM="Noctiluca scintillans" /LENGTH=333 /DNA_ID=CAMNT_0039346219 /DNA_START=84 /DNA_END=1085 /DNA_ORIENTATION=+
MHVRSLHGEDHHDVMSKGPIAVLQEYVQCYQEVPLPQSCSVLQWDYDTQMPEHKNLEFRGAVSFRMDGVPHHVAGTWQRSKKLAQRDTAERALGLFVGRWSSHLKKTEDVRQTQARLCPERVASQCDADCVQNLEHFVIGNFGASSLSWRMQCVEGQCRALVHFSLLGVPHQFVGDFEATEEAAKGDTSRRVLWYLRCPEYEDRYDADLSMSATPQKIAPPPAYWASNSAEADALKDAEQKTALMRVQNRLQQQFSKQLKPGQPVWEWSFKFEPAPAGQRSVCCATVRLAISGQEYVGHSVLGQRHAQINACAEISRALDGMEVSKKAAHAGA